MIAERAPATLELALVSGLLALIGGIVFGIYTAINRGGFLANIIMTSSLIGVSLPTFLIGILLMWIFAVELRWLPSNGRGEVVDLGWWTTGLLTTSGLKSLVLPAITLGLFQLTLIMRLVRAEMLEVLKMDYIRTARAMGLPEHRVLYSHASAQHADPGDRDHRPPVRLDHRFRDHHRKRVPVARAWPAVHRRHPVRRRAHHGRLSVC